MIILAKLWGLHHIPLLTANSLPLSMWYRRFFISNGERLSKCSEAASPSQLSVRDSSLAITWMMSPTRRRSISWNSCGSVRMNMAR